MSDSGIIFDIKRFAVHDGPGIRTTVFLKGCSLNCWWCHNPEGRNSEIQSVKKNILLNGRMFCEDESIGRIMSVDEVMEEVLKDSIFYEESGGGVTFSGGEPFFQPDFLFGILRACKSAGLHTTVDTSGYVETHTLLNSSNLVDLYLFDLKLFDDDLHQDYTGVSNRLILKNLKELKKISAQMIIRFPVIPEVTDTKENISAFRNYLKAANGSIREINLLPYHPFAQPKYIKLGMENRMPSSKPVDRLGIQNLADQLSDLGIKIKIGG